MFTGIVTACGNIAAADAHDGGLRVRIETDDGFLTDVAAGDSIAVNGVCLTAIRLDGNAFEADVSPETLNCTAGFAQGTRVNLEKSLRLSDRQGVLRSAGARHQGEHAIFKKFEDFVQQGSLGVFLGKLPSRLAQRANHHGHRAQHFALGIEQMDRNLAPAPVFAQRRPHLQDQWLFHGNPRKGGIGTKTQARCATEFF